MVRREQAKACDGWQGQEGGLQGNQKILIKEGVNDVLSSFLV
jgi:hypothetical protein